MPLTHGLQLVCGVQPVNPVPVDCWSGPYTGSVDTIESAKITANSSIPLAVRYKSMEVRLIVQGTSYKYWYKDDVNDNGLVEFITDCYTTLIIANNGSGDTINKGQVVQVIGSTLTGVLSVDLAIANKVDASTNNILGVAYEPINSGVNGKILTTGYLSGLSINNEFSGGDAIYLSSMNSGSFTNIRTTPPIDLVKIGYVTTVSNSNGAIFVNVK